MCDAPQEPVVLTLPAWAVFWELEESAQPAQYLSSCLRVKNRLFKEVGGNTNGLGGCFLLFNLNLAVPVCVGAAGLSFTRFVQAAAFTLLVSVPALTLLSLPPSPRNTIPQTLPMPMPS